MGEEHGWDAALMESEAKAWGKNAKAEGIDPRLLVSETGAA